MASLTITVGQLTASATSNNATAANILNRYADSIGANGTNQQRANAVIAALVRHMVEQGQRHLANQTMTTAVSQIQTELEEDWTGS